MIAASTTLAMVSEAKSQTCTTPPPAPWNYRFYDISNGFESTAFGMNVHHQVVGQYVAGDDDVHAFLFLPEADYGLSAGFHDLNDVFDPSNQDPPENVAYDISNGGIIVGASDDVAVMWDLNLVCVTGLVDDPDAGVSAAISINDPSGTDPSIVGWFEDTTQTCLVVGAGPGGGLVGDPYPAVYDTGYLGFRADLDKVSGGYCGSSSIDNVVVLALPYSSLTSGLGIGGTLESESSYPTSGGSRHCANPPCTVTLCTPAGNDPANCEVNRGVTWDGDGSDPHEQQLDGYQVGSGDIRRAEGYAMNHENKVVGYSAEEFNDGSGDECRTRGAYWNNRSSAAVLLPFLRDVNDDPIPSVTMYSTNIADGLVLDESGEYHFAVTGVDAENTVAVLWSYNTTANPADPCTIWWAHDLNEITVNQIGNGSNDFIPAAFDINESGFGCGRWSDIDGAAITAKACLLMRVDPCETDLDDSGATDVTDLLMLLDSWGETGYLIPADFDGNGEVGSSDILLLLAQWGTCGGIGTGVPSTVEDCLERYEDGSLAQEKCLEALED